MIRLVSSVIFVVALFVCVQMARAAGGDQTPPPVCARYCRAALRRGRCRAPPRAPAACAPAACAPRSSAVANRAVVDLHKGPCSAPYPELRRPHCAFSRDSLGRVCLVPCQDTVAWVQDQTRASRSDNPMSEPTFSPNGLAKVARLARTGLPSSSSKPRFVYASTRGIITGAHLSYL